ncbi:low-density lipoprotein receptor-related protein 1B-like [Arvicanthis niloticus]|uniref:low-density lipoprotein receptor-related protein 1B-like n=1 Tax=Arvicanthis niloticus TaxID=61156 RepID=UPI00402B1A2D
MHDIKFFLFWTEWGQVPCIGKARLDGSEKVMIVSMGITWPNGISIDYEENKLYWCDARSDKIERIDLDTGGNREVLLSGSNVDLFSVAVFGAYIYWSDRAHANGSVRRGHKNDATETVTMRTGLGVNLKEIKIFNRGREKVRPYENPLYFKNIIALAFDYNQRRKGTNRIFYSDAHFGNIQLIKDNWEDRQVIVESLYFILW